MIHRELTQVIENRLFSGKAIILVGARQVGKTTLMRTIANALESPVLSLNCDDPDTRAQLGNTNMSELKLLVGENKTVMIDEAQRVENIGLTLKMITDNFEGVQLIVTGSSALDLHSKINEPLTGRKLEYQLFPISTKEIVETYGLLEAKRQLKTRLIYGSYPDIIAHPSDAREYLLQLTDSYLYKDIMSLDGLRKPTILNRLLQALAFQVGSEVSLSELAQTLQADRKTIDRYIDLLEKSYIIFSLHGLSRNLRSELKRGRKIYFYDNGVRNAVIQQFSPLEMRNDQGALWENFFISERIKHNHYRRHFCNYYFWRTTSQQEIDFIEEIDGQMKAYEMKWNSRKKVSFPKTFTEAYPVDETTVVTPDDYISHLV